eukprot:4084765-Pyramimonas_sp.AAC.1
MTRLHDGARVRLIRSYERMQRHRHSAGRQTAAPEVSKNRGVKNPTVGRRRAARRGIRRSSTRGQRNARGTRDAHSGAAAAGAFDGSPRGATAKRARGAPQ